MPNLPAMRAQPTGTPMDQKTGLNVKEPIAYVESGTQGKGYARGWLRPLLTFLTGRTRTEAGAVVAIKPAAPRDFMGRTQDSLQLGPSPQGITRIFTEKLGGLTGPGYPDPSPRYAGAGAAPGGSLPYFANWAYIPHQNIDRRDGGKISGGPLGTPFGMGGMADDTYIPAIYAGNAPSNPNQGQ